MFSHILQGRLMIKSMCLYVKNINVRYVNFSIFIKNKMNK